MEEEGFRDGDFSGGVEEGRDLVGGSGLEHDFVEERLLAVATAAGVLGVFVVVESIVGCLAEVTAPENEGPEGDVERVEKAFPVVASEELRPWSCGLGCGFHGDGCRYEMNGRMQFC